MKKHCCNCENTENLKKLYIVAPDKGGKDLPTNIIYICDSCYNLSSFKKSKSGRPSLFSFEKIEPIMKDYFECRITTTQAKDKIGISPKNKSSWQKALKLYKDKHNIKTNRNNISVISSNGNTLNDNNRVLGYVVYNNGKKYAYTRNDKVEIDCVGQQYIREKEY